MINYARGGAIELYVQIISPTNSVFTKALHLKTLNSRLPCLDALLEGCLYSLDWTTGLDYWTGLDWTTGLDYWTDL